MKKPRDIVTTPNGNWRYTQPETGKPFEHPNPKVLFNQIWEHRHSLPHFNMDVSGGWKDRLWSDICAEDPYLPCDDTEDKGTWVGMGDIWRFLGNMKDWVTGGMQLVSQETAEKRARICTGADTGKKCPKNEVVGACWGCRGIAKLLDSIIGERKTSQTQALETCTACKCALRAKIWLPQDAVKIDPDKAPPFCWATKDEE